MATSSSLWQPEERGISRGRELHNKQDLLQHVFGALDRHSIRYCVLHSWQNLNDGDVDSDVDMAVHPDDLRKIPPTLETVTERGYRVVQCVNHAADAFCFVIMWIEGTTRIRSLALDMTCEHRVGPLTVLTGEDAVIGRWRCDHFWAASSEVEFAYLLSKKAAKRHASSHQIDRLMSLAFELGEEKAIEVASNVLPDAWSRRATAACMNGNIEDVLPKLRQRYLYATLRHPLQLARFFLRECARLRRRIQSPTGLLLVVLGPDGVGKSTLVTQLTSALSSAFRAHRLFHWRPGLFCNRSDKPVERPHDQPARNLVASLVQLFGVLTDYSLGLLLLVHPSLVRSGLIVFDRYIYDLAIDPLRYRYSGPAWLVQWLSRLVSPKGTLVLVLDAPAELILSRKCEVETEEVDRQRSAYRQIVHWVPNTALIATDNSVEQTAAKATMVIMHYLQERVLSRYRYWLRSA